MRSAQRLRGGPLWVLRSCPNQPSARHTTGPIGADIHRFSNLPRNWQNAFQRREGF
jgi:hypothetical protein